MPAYLLETKDPISECLSCPCMDVDERCAASNRMEVDLISVGAFGSRPDWCPLEELGCVERSYVIYHTGQYNMLLECGDRYPSLRCAWQELARLKKTHEDWHGFCIAGHIESSLGVVHEEE